MTKIRGFEKVSRYEVNLPKRATKNAACYDIESAVDINISPNKTVLIPTGIKVFMQDDEVFELYDRSSNPKKVGIVLTNSVGIIDSDYYNNPDNEGQIFGQFTNITDKMITIEKGQRIMQGKFTKYLLADDDEATATRTGGFGSTGE